MSTPVILMPLLAQVLLTFGLLLRMAVLRRGDLNRGTVRYSDIGLREPGWPVRTQQTVYSFSNQFELPVLFYLLTVLEVITRQAGITFVVFAWIFVASRFVHAYIHITSNVVPWRGNAYAVGVLVLIAMWITFIIRIMSGLS
jgi:hypothetical protein